MKKVLIFGAGGFVGSYLAKEFMSNEYKVYGTDIKQGDRFPKEAKFFISDLMNSDCVEKLIDDIVPDIIVNLAAISSVGASWITPQATIQINVVGAINIMEAAKRCSKKPKIMFIGSSEEYVMSDMPMNENCPLNASNPYGISKITQEQISELYRNQYGLQIYYVRPFNHTGIGQSESFVLPNFCKQVAEIEKQSIHKSIKVGNLSVKRDFSHVKDIVRAYRLIIESDNCDTVYNVGSGEAYSLQKILEYIISLSSQNIEIEVDSTRFRPIDQPVICCDNSLIRSQLGWEPEYTVFDALKEMFEYFCEN